MRSLSWLILVFIAFVFSGCQSSGKIKGPKYGGTLHLNLTEIPDIIFPGQVFKESEQVIIDQVYNGLVTFHPKTLEIIPQIARTWAIDSAQTHYKFYLIPEARFQDDNCFTKGLGRQITASDFKYSIEQIARYHLISSHSPSKQLLNIVGFEQFRQNGNDEDGISGIKVINDTTLSFLLQEPDPMFIYFLAGSNGLVFPREAFEKYGFKSTVGSGPFSFTYPSIKGTTMYLTANPNYFRRNQVKEQLPFLDSLVISFVSSPPKELRLFENGSLDLILGLPEEYLAPFLESHIKQFESNPPYYVLKRTSGLRHQTIYHILRANIHDLDINSQGYLDFSGVFFGKPQEKENNKEE